MCWFCTSWSWPSTPPLSLACSCLGVEEVLTSCNVITDGCRQFNVMLLTACNYVRQGPKKHASPSIAFVFSGGLPVLKFKHFLPCSPDACRRGRPIALHVFFCQAEGGGQTDLGTGVHLCKAHVRRTHFVREYGVCCWSNVRGTGCAVKGVREYGYAVVGRNVTPSCPVDLSRWQKGAYSLLTHKQHSS